MELKCYRSPWEMGLLHGVTSTVARCSRQDTLHLICFQKKGKNGLLKLWGIGQQVDINICFKKIYIDLLGAYLN